MKSDNPQTHPSSRFLPCSHPLFGKSLAAGHRQQARSDIYFSSKLNTKKDYVDRPLLLLIQLFRLKDRKGTEHLLAPTHEEEITALVAKEVVGWRSLPVRVYQIGKATTPHTSRPLGRGTVSGTCEDSDGLARFPSF
jgi:hypothetical protein